MSCVPKHLLTTNMRKIPHIIFASLGDFFTPRVLLVSTLSFALTILFFIACLFFFFGGVELFSQWCVDWMSSFENTIEQNWFLRFISLIFITKAIVGILFFFTSMIVVYYLFLMVYSFIVGLFCGYFIKEIRQKYYPEVVFKEINFLSYLFFVMKTFLVGTFLFLLLFPFAFIPLLNLILFVPIYYIFHKMLVLDVASVVNSKEEYLKIKKVNGGEMKGISLICFLLTIIPILGVVIYPFYVIVMSHFIFEETKALRVFEDGKKA